VESEIVNLIEVENGIVAGGVEEKEKGWSKDTNIQLEWQNFKSLCTI
jgi:hypothetical protein